MSEHEDAATVIDFFAVQFPRMAGVVRAEVARLTRELEEARADGESLIFAREAARVSRFLLDTVTAERDELRARLAQAEASLQIQTNEAATHLDAWRKEAALHTRAAVDVMRLTRELEEARADFLRATKLADGWRAEDRDTRTRLVQVEAAHATALTTLTEQVEQASATIRAQRDRYRAALEEIAAEPVPGAEVHPCSCVCGVQAARRALTPPEGGAE